MIDVAIHSRSPKDAPTAECVRKQRKIAKRPKKEGLEIVTSLVVQLICVMPAQKDPHLIGFTRSAFSSVCCS